MDGPAADWLSAAEAAAWLGIGQSLLAELRAAGDFPAPVQLGRRKAHRFFWLDIVAWGHLRSISREREATSSTEGRRRPASG